MIDQPPSVTEGAYRVLREEILQGRVLPGAKLKIGELCTRLDINLSAVREALTRLAAEGIITAEPQRGFRAAPVSRAELLDLTNTRCDIETLCLSKAIDRADSAWEARVAAASQELMRTPPVSGRADPSGYANWHRAHENYHAVLCSGCESPWLLRLRNQLTVQAERYVRLSLLMGRRRRSAVDEHRRITNAVLGRDKARVASLISEHFRITTDNLLAALDLEADECAGLANGRAPHVNQSDRNAIVTSLK